MQLLDHFLISVPHVFDEGEGDIKTMNAAHYIDKERDRYERKVMKGIVHKAPLAFREINHMPIDPGFPNHKLFVSHDAIQEMVNKGYKWDNTSYHPGIKEHFEYITIADYGRMITAKEGDEIYFHPSVTELENYHGEINGQSLFKASVHELISVGTVPQGGYVLVKPHMEDTKHGDLVVTLEDTHRLLEGTVKYARPESKLSGAFVYFQEGSDWIVNINGERLFAMLEENVLLKKD